MFTIYEQMLSERQRLEDQAKSIEGQIHSLPVGKLIWTRNEKRIKCYRSDGHNQVYISQKNKKLIEQLAAKILFPSCSSTLLIILFQPFT